MPKPTLELPDRPNILWLVAEDLGPYISPFGDSTAYTPNLDRLAAQGVCFDNFYSPSGVCAPSRAAIATGMYPTRIGANHMRTGPWYAGDVPEDRIREYTARALPAGLTSYDAIPPPEVKMMSEVLRRAGYYCTNNAKQDYQFRKPVTAWDESSKEAHWRKRAPGQPFFSVFNFEVTHESRIWNKAEDSLWIDPSKPIPIPPYLPDTEVGQKDVRRMYSNIMEMDHQVGEVLDQLEEDGELENTIIFWYTDHGGPLPRMKRLLYDSGIKVPMIIRFPGEQMAGTRNDDLLSFIDFAPTVMSLAGINPPVYLDGQAFLGDYQAEEKRKYIHAAADRFDETYDTNRAVRDKQYKYIRYYQTDLPMFLHVDYRDQMAIMQELYRLR
ncbi:MAG: sulfatase family protein, partial [Cyclobacteriaceae bacterium]